MKEVINLGKTYVAVDIGASSGRLMLGEKSNDQLKLKEIYRFKNGFTFEDGHNRWNIDRLISEIFTGLHKVKLAGYSNISLGIDTWGVDYVLVNQDGNKISNPISYRDHRTANSVIKLTQKYSKEYIYEKTGIQFLNFNTLYQLFEEDSNLLERTKWIMMIPNYIGYVLTGKAVTEVTNASTTQMLNLREGLFDDNLLKTLNKESKFTWKGFSTVLGLALILFATMVINMIAYIKLAEFYVESHIGTPTQASTVLSIFGIAQLVGSALFGIVYKLFKNWTLYIGMLFSASPLIGIGYAHSNLVVTAMFILMGLLGGLAIPYIFTKVAGVTNTKNAPLFNGIVLVGSNMGSFCAPILGKVLGGASARLAMLHGGYLLSIITIVVILIMEITRRMKRAM